MQASLAHVTIPEVSLGVGLFVLGAVVGAWLLARAVGLLRRDRR